MAVEETHCFHIDWNNLPSVDEPVTVDVAKMMFDALFDFIDQERAKNPDITPEELIEKYENYRHNPKWLEEYASTNRKECNHGSNKETKQRAAGKN